MAFDVETTGLNPQTDRIVEVGAVTFDRSGPIGRYEQLVNPGCPISPAATAIHGITDADVATSPPLRTILPELVEFTGDAVLVAHNAPFDAGFLETAFSEAGMEPLTNPILCTVELARAVFPGLVNYKLTTLVDVLRIPAGAHHRALADASYSGEILRRCIERIDPTWELRFDDLLSRHGPPHRFGIAPAQALEAIEAALDSGSQVQIEYRDNRGNFTIRKITPIRIERRGRSTMVTAFCHLRGEERTFRLESIKRIL